MSDEASVEQRATQMGWVPKDQWRRDPAQWVDAGEFVRRGEQILPILQAREQRTSQENQQLRQELERQRAAFNELQGSVSELTKFNQQVAIERAKGEKKTLLGEIADAKRSNDVERETNLQDQLNQANEKIRLLEAKKTETPPQQQQQKDPNSDPVFVSWRQENSWYGTDIRRTGLANAVAIELRQNPETANLSQRDFLNRVAEEVSKTLDGNGRRNGAARVEGGQPSGQGGGSNSGIKTYADLPQDAKDACDRQGKKLIGPNKAFKTDAEWQKHYANQYFSE